jgi:serpin B
MNGLMIRSNLKISFPRFKFSDSYELAEPLSAMGLRSLFHSVDLSKMSSALAHGFISRVIHKTFIDVDEKGTKAAAATVISHTKSASKQSDEFRADRPFAFLIIHNPTKAILFAGVVNNPVQH